MKKSLLFLGLITIFSFSECLAKSTCSGYDIATNSVNITSISSGSVNYNF